MTVIYVCKIIISSSVFSIFLKISIFWVHSGVKGQKMVQNGKKSCLWHSISQEPYIIWLSFMVQMSKVIPPGVIFNVKILIFQVPGCQGAARAKKLPKMLKISVCRTLCFRNHISYDLDHLWFTCMYKRIIRGERGGGI